jgi:hypothetical protein
MLIEANLCMANAILFAMRMPLPPGYPPLVHFNNVVPQLLLEPVRVLSAPLLGNWDTNLSSVGGRLDTTKVCSYLSRPQFAHQVAKVTAAKQGGCASRFQNLSLYIRKECLTVSQRLCHICCCRPRPCTQEDRSIVTRQPALHSVFPESCTRNPEPITLMSRARSCGRLITLDKRRFTSTCMSLANAP